MSRLISFTAACLLTFGLALQASASTAILLTGKVKEKNRNVIVFQTKKGVRHLQFDKLLKGDKKKIQTQLATGKKKEIRLSVPRDAIDDI